MKEKLFHICYAESATMKFKTNTKINDKQQYAIVLEEYLPKVSVDYVLDYFEKYPFSLVFTNPRATKKGTFSVERENFYKITVNAGMSKDETLLVFLHELAHLITHVIYKRVKPHGQEWKMVYRSLLQEACDKHFFGSDLCAVIKECYFGKKQNNIATECVELQLYFNPKKGELLRDLLPQTKFCLKHRPKKCFVLEQHRRTKSLCKDLKTGRLYLVDQLAEVKRKEKVSD